MKTLVIPLVLLLSTSTHAFAFGGLYCDKQCKAEIWMEKQQAGSEYLKKITAIKRNEERSKACRALAHDRSIGVKIGFERAMIICDDVDMRWQ